MHTLRSLDWWIIGLVILLMVVGLVSIFSVTRETPRAIDVWKQVVFVTAAVVIMIAGSSVDYRAFRASNTLTLGLYLGSVALLAGLLVLGTTVRGVRSWYVFGSISFQPVELMKVGLLVVLAKYFSTRNIELYRLRHIIASGIYAGVPIALVLLQPDAGGAFILFALWLLMVVVSGIRLKAFLFLVITVVMIAAVFWGTMLKPYQKERLVSFMQTEQDVRGSGYQRNQALMAIGGGGVTGQGVGAGLQSQSGALPEAHTDFIFASIAEEWGYLGALGLLAIFFVIWVRLLLHARHASNNMGRLLLAGVAVLLFVQVTINVAVNMGLLPVVGLPLPFVSYGGSNMVFSAVALAVAQSVIVRSHKLPHSVVEYV